MTYWNGFASGIIVGFLATLIATGTMIIGEHPESVRGQAVFALFLVFLFSSVITFYQANQRKSLFSPSWDGFFGGFSFIEAIVIFALYGFRL